MLRTRGDKMIGWLWLAAVLALAAPSSAGHHRRSMPTQSALPLSKGGWRPVIGSGGLVYGAYGTAPLHAPPTYKVPAPVPVQDQYASSARPLVTRDATKLTSIAQSYRPTTLRTIPTQPPLNQPINSYHNPYNNGLTHYKYIQNFPVESVLIRNPHNPYAARPVFTKYPQKFKQPIQQHVQPVQYQYQTGKPFDIYPKPADYSKPEKKPQSSETEIYKPEVYKLPDNEAAQQALNQQVKTAQQQTFPVQGFAQNFPGQKIPVNPYSHYTFQDNSFPPRIFGTFSPFNVQSVKGQNSGFPTRTTFIPQHQQPTRQTIFNSFSYSPNYKQTPNYFPTTTPKLQSTVNQIHFGTAVTDYNKNVPTQPPKVSTAPKIDPNAGNKGGFKASPQDPFSKQYSSDYNKVTTYNPVQTTTLANYYNDFQYPVQQNFQAQNYYDQQTINANYEKKKHKIHDNFAAGGNQEVSQQYINPPSHLEGTPNSVPFRATYEVTETYSDELHTHSSKAPWTASPDYDNQKVTDESVTKQQYYDSSFKPETTPIPEEFAIVTEAEKGYENSLNYDGNVESQSRRPLGDDFEPIGKHKLKDYYYKVTPSYDDHSPPRRTKKPTEAYKQTSTQAATTTTTTTTGNDENNDLLVEPLPTLPPNKHFKRPSTIPPTEKEKQRKRIKNRRRRPPLANIHHREESSTAKYIQSSTEPAPTTDVGDEYQAFTRRPSKYKSQYNLTTPGVNDDLITSALPTIAPTYPTIAKKKLGHRRPLTTTERYETTTQSYRDYDSNNESPIMKIATRPQLKVTQRPIETKSETPDYTHKQDEKDTPTSDIAVSLSDTLKTTRPDKDFSFHRDLKPLDAELEPIRGHRETTTQSLSSEVTATTTTPRVETTPDPPAKVLRPRLKNKYESNRPRFSVKDYRNRLSSTTSTTEKSADTQHAPKVRFPQRRPYNENNRYNSENDTATERKKFVPKDPRHKVSDATEAPEQAEQTHARQSSRVRQTTVEPTEGTTQKISSRIRNGSRRPRPTTEEATEPTTPTTVTHKRLIRKKIKDSEIGESVQDISVTETTTDHKEDITSERTRSESAIMKIADKKHHDPIEHLFEHSKRVSDLTLAASKDYNTPGMFKTVSQSSRRVPSYFTIATDDPILPIEAFFPQLNQKKES
ncbi:adhesive plaque matrix protein-like [Cydia splendana]|uniref:adhesive plaque matrix protein-like n=1 Tax=Cydia splendana TaxID=1100963 RepID=UPI00300C26E6